MEKNMYEVVMRVFYNDKMLGFSILLLKVGVGHWRTKGQKLNNIDVLIFKLE